MVYRTQDLAKLAQLNALEKQCDKLEAQLGPPLRPRFRSEWAVMGFLTTFLLVLFLSMGSLCGGGTKLMRQTEETNMVKKAAVHFLLAEAHECPSVQDLIAEGHLDASIHPQLFRIECQESRIVVTHAGDDEMFGTYDDITTRRQSN